MSQVTLPDSASSSEKRVAPSSVHERLPAPEGAKPVRVRWVYSISIVVMHFLALLALVPWLFSWSGVVWVLLGHHLFGMLGITLGYHRLLTHRGFTCPRWFEHMLAVLGVCTLQDTPARWVATHRKHHQHSDEQPDPHSPLVTFLWGHVGWLLTRNREHDTIAFYEHYARDLLRDPFYMRLEKGFFWFTIYLAHAAMFVIAGFLLGWALTGTVMGGVQLGASWLVWGVFVRTVFVWHGTWAVNSITHTWGYKNYELDDNSRNNWLVALLAHGEGWHNNHHAEQRAAAHGHRWWEFDITWLIILGLEKIGFVKDVVRPKSWSKS